MLNVVMLSVTMLNVVMLDVVMLSGVALSLCEVQKLHSSNSDIFEMSACQNLILFKLFKV